MSVQLGINAESQGVKTTLTGLAYKAQNLEPVFKVFGEHMIRSIARNFKAGGRPVKWTPSIRAQETGGKTLIKFRDLQNSVTPREDNSSLTLGTNVIYARIHQLGGQAGRGRKVTIPARPYLVVQESDIEYLNGLIGRHLTG